VWLLAAAGLGYFGPRLAVGWLRAARQRRLQRSLPNMMDMLVSCLEAGLGVDAALRYLAREVDVSSPVLADELRLANVSMTAGVPRTEALRDFDRRTGIEEITALVSVLSQAERFGAGVAPSVRAHAQLARRRRAVEAEQRAAQAAPYLTVAMVVLIMPSLFVVLVGPTVVNILQNFYPNGTVGLP
jgi:tight adherence protein C